MALDVYTEYTRAMFPAEGANTSESKHTRSLHLRHPRYKLLWLLRTKESSIVFYGTQYKADVKTSRCALRSPLHRTMDPVQKLSHTNRLLTWSWM